MEWLQSLLGREQGSSSSGHKNLEGRRNSSSVGVEMINRLGTCHGKLNLPETCSTRAALELHSLHRDTRSAESQSEAYSSDWAMQFPLQLRVTGGCQGRPDLHLQLFTLDMGSHVCSKVIKTSERPTASTHRLAKGSLGLAGKAASLVFLQLTLPDKAAITCRASALVTCCCLVTGPEARKAASRRFPALSRSARKRLNAAKAAYRRRMSHQRLDLQGAATQARIACSWVEYQICHPAAALTLGGILWCCIHPTSFHMVKCLAAALPVQAGYASTTRKSARGDLVPGAGMEEAWRRRHRWAARRLAPMQTDLWDAPPLAPLYNVLETLSLAIAVALDATDALMTKASGTTWAPLGLCASFAAGGAGAPPPFAGHPASSPPAVGKPVGPGQTQTAASLLAVNGDLDVHQAPTARGHDASARHHFIPSSNEEFETSRLPTIRSRSELESAAPHADGIATRLQTRMPSSPFEAAASRPLADEEPQDSPREIEMFGSRELMELDAARGDMAEEGLDLYGRADHLQKTPLPTTVLERCEMTMRAFYLLMVFMPFMMFGPLLLFLASLVSRRSQQPSVVDRTVCVNGGGPEPSGATQRVQASVSETAEKAPAQFALGPGEGADPGHEIEAAGPLPLAKRLRLTAWQLLLVGVRASGAAFIKWGQWSATREDMFPEEFCMVLSELHDKAPEHSWRASKREIEAVFGRSVEELFDSIDHKALASGSIAQVHRAVLRVNGKPREVVVKVRHPMVAERLSQDFRLLIPLAAATSKVRSLKGLSLKSSLEQFSATMTAQTDLRVESAHLRRFFRNFAAIRSSCTPPFPLPGFETASVLVETFEPGHSVARYISQPAACNTQIVALGVNAYLKMLLHDNFVHTDLHPGNILVRERPPKPGVGQRGPPPATGPPQQRQKPLQMVLLDFGLAEELTPVVRRHFISLLHMIGKGDGHRAAYHMLHMGKQQDCPNPAAFATAMSELFVQISDINAPKGIDLDQVMKAMLHLARQHEVTVDSSYAALVVGVCVIVGFATSLDPGLNLMDAATPAFLMHNLTGRIMGRLYA